MEEVPTVWDREKVPEWFWRISVSTQRLPVEDKARAAELLGQLSACLQIQAGLAH